MSKKDKSESAPSILDEFKSLPRHERAAAYEHAREYTKELAEIEKALREIDQGMHVIH